MQNALPPFNFCTGDSYDCLGARVQLSLLQLCWSNAQRTSWYSLTSPFGRRPGQRRIWARAGTTSVPWTRVSVPLLVMPKRLQAFSTLD
eukprot:5819543-Amphidinium_carterae.1